MGHFSGIESAVESKKYKKRKLLEKIPSFLYCESVSGLKLAEWNWRQGNANRAPEQ